MWLIAELFNNCKNRSTKNSNWNNPASAVPTEEEIKLFRNCYVKSLKGIKISDTIIN